MGPQGCQEWASTSTLPGMPSQASLHPDSCSLSAASKQSQALSMRSHVCRGKPSCSHSREGGCASHQTTRRSHSWQCGTQWTPHPSGNGESHAGLAQRPSPQPHVLLQHETATSLGLNPSFHLTASHALNPSRCKNNLNTTN